MKVMPKFMYSMMTIGITALIVAILLPTNWSICQSHFISFPPSIVYDELNQLKNRTHWEQLFSEDKLLTTTYNSIPAGAGSSYSWRSPKNGIGTITVIDCQQNKWLQEEWLLNGKQQVQITYTLKPVNGGTLLQTTLHTTADGILSKLMAYGWIKPSVNKQLKQNAARLQSYLQK